MTSSKASRIALERQVYDLASVDSSSGELVVWDTLIYPAVVRRREFEFIDANVRAAEPRIILDVGCGAGVFTALLSHYGYEVVGIDSDPDIVSLAREMVAHFRAPARIEQGSADDLISHHDAFNLVYSLGVVEHFDREVTVSLIKEQARCANLVLVAVPTKHTRYAGPITDEHLYTRAEMKQIVRDAGLTVRRSYVYGDVPTWLAANLDRFLPRAPYKVLKNWFSYGMGTVVLGER